jgi:hypothetical protein
VFQNLEELIIVWTDAADLKSSDWRAVNYIEGVPGDWNRTFRRYSAWTKSVNWRNSIVEAWEARRWWDRLGRKPPVVMVRHWRIWKGNEW